METSLSELRKELTSLINKYSLENGSNTPDFILAEYLMDCLTAYDVAVSRRSAWYGGVDKISTGTLPTPPASDGTQESE